MVSVLALFALTVISGAALWQYRAGKLAVLDGRTPSIRPIEFGDAGGRCTLLMIGDSHVERWPVAPPSGWRVLKFGFPGESAVNIASVMPVALRSSAPDAVLIAAGTNDASAGALQGEDERAATLDRATRAIERMIADAKKGGARRVLVATLVPPRLPGLWRRVIYGQRQASALDGLSKDIATRAIETGADIFDANTLARDQTGKFRPELRSDALHWSPAGYDILSATLWRDIGACGKS